MNGFTQTEKAFSTAGSGKRECFSPFMQNISPNIGRNSQRFCNFALYLRYCSIISFVLMIDYIKGQLTELTPTYAIVEAAGVGYEINIALPTYTALVDKQEAKLFVNEIIREDAHLLFGFLSKAERSLFLLLISVSGIGANTARMIMSSYSAAEIRQIIATGNAAALSNIKGIGGKTAQRIIVELKDKVLKIDINGIDNIDIETVTQVDNDLKQEAVAALTMLGFAPNVSGKAVDKILKEDPTLPIEKVIKQALKML